MKDEHKPTSESDRFACSVPSFLLDKTFAIEHNPNCAKPFLVRLVRRGNGRLDKKTYIKFRNNEQTDDCIGFGDTLTEAAINALNEQSHIWKMLTSISIERVNMEKINNIATRVLIAVCIAPIAIAIADLIGLI